LIYVLSSKQIGKLRLQNLPCCICHILAHIK